MEDTSARPFVIVVIGPESIGKTRLARALSDRLRAELVEEFTREYALGRTGGRDPWRDFEYVLVAEEQALRQAEAARAAGNGFVVCDTDAFTVWVWHRFYTGRPIDEILDIARSTPCDLYVLPSAEDTQFVPDGVRDSVLPQPELWELFRDALDESGADYVVVHGDVRDRLAQLDAEIARRRAGSAR